MKCHSLDRPARDQTMVVQGPKDFERGKNPVYAVELTSGWLRIQVRPGDDRGQAGIRAFAPCEYVAHRIDGDTRTRLFAPSHKQIAAFPVVIGEGLPVTSARGRRTDSRHLHQVLPQALAVNTQGVHVRDFRCREGFFMCRLPSNSRLREDTTYTAK